QAIQVTRPELSPYAPRITKITINPDRIRDIIGPGGKVIRRITEETKCTIDIEDDGTVLIGSTSAENTQKAIDIIRGLTRDVEVGTIYTGKVTRIMAFGAFVEVLPGKEGLVHISELADYRVPSVEDVVKIGDEITVLVTEIDRQGRINLSRRALLAPTPEGEGPGRPPMPTGAGGRGPNGRENAGRPTQGNIIRGGGRGFDRPREPSGGPRREGGPPERHRPPARPGAPERPPRGPAPLHDRPPVARPNPRWDEGLPHED